MGEEKQNLQEMGLKKELHWAANKKDDEGCESLESSSIDDDDSSACSSSLSSSDMADDASSSSSGSSPSDGPLYQLSDLMSQLPSKRGLSKYYHGKSQTFASLANVKSLEDLAKEDTDTPFSRRMKSCKSYAGKLNHQHKFGPKATITKRSPRRSFSPPTGRNIISTL